MSKIHKVFSKETQIPNQNLGRISDIKNTNLRPLADVYIHMEKKNAIPFLIAAICVSLSMLCDSSLC